MFLQKEEEDKEEDEQETNKEYLGVHRMYLRDHSV